jgi:hypothetical protein
MCAVAAGVDDALRDPLMVEMENLLPEMKILDQGRTARTDLERILVIRDRTALGGGQHRDIATCGLDEVRPLAPAQLLIVNRRRSGRRRLAGCLLVDLAMSFPAIIAELIECQVVACARRANRSSD